VKPAEPADQVREHSSNEGVSENEWFILARIYALAIRKCCAQEQNGLDTAPDDGGIEIVRKKPP
jgi:hypothetical protein